jgi:hypothetical protein
MKFDACQWLSAFTTMIFDRRGRRDNINQKAQFIWFYSINQSYQKNRLSQQLFKVFIVLTLRPLHVSAYIGHLQAEHTIYKEVITPTTDPLYNVEILLYTFLANTAVVYLIVIARHLIVNAITSFLILKCWSVAVKILKVYIKYIINI